MVIFCCVVMFCRPWLQLWTPTSSCMLSSIASDWRTGSQRKQIKQLQYKQHRLCFLLNKMNSPLVFIFCFPFAIIRPFTKLLSSKYVAEFTIVFYPTILCIIWNCPQSCHVPALPLGIYHLCKICTNDNSQILENGSIIYSGTLQAVLLV